MSMSVQRELPGATPVQRRFNGGCNARPTPVQRGCDIYPLYPVRCTALLRRRTQSRQPRATWIQQVFRAWPTAAGEGV